MASGEADVIAAGGPGPSEVDLEVASTRVALKFIFSQEGVWFREFLMDELVKSVDALSRDQAAQVVRQLGLSGLQVPVFLPFASKSMVPIEPSVSEDDR